MARGPECREYAAEKCTRSPSNRDAIHMGRYHTNVPVVFNCPYTGELVTINRCRDRNMYYVCEAPTCLQSSVLSSWPKSHYHQCLHVASMFQQERHHDRSRGTPRSKSISDNKKKAVQAIRAASGRQRYHPYTTATTSSAPEPSSSSSPPPLAMKTETDADMVIEPFTSSSSPGSTSAPAPIDHATATRAAKVEAIMAKDGNGIDYLLRTLDRMLNGADTNNIVNIETGTVGNISWTLAPSRVESGSNSISFSIREGSFSFQANAPVPMTVSFPSTA
ncbi:hypothetical protein B0O80DRAFT_40446 [Mortierella sp. GBAus27b]|nr:hypothetical protein B0O80DRAFT_40446 [Mortierella sp. GBAus27b]